MENVLDPSRRAVYIIDIAPAVLRAYAVWELCFWDCGAESSRGERYSGVNYELAGRSRHSQ